MELPVAIKEITEKWGNSVVTEKRILLFLGKKKCFTDFPEYKEVYRSILNVGYAQRILDLLDNDDWNEELIELAETFDSRLPYDTNDVYYVFYSIAYGIGLTTDNSIPVNENHVDSEEVFEDDIDNEEDNEDIETDSYTINKQYHEKKGIDIYVVRPKFHLDSDSFAECRERAKEYGKGYYSSYQGVKGFVFQVFFDAQNFAEDIIASYISEEDNNQVTDKLQEQETSNLSTILMSPSSPLANLSNMTLPKALRMIIDTDGYDIIKDIRLVNILSDLNAYNNFPASKYILRAIISDGYTDKLLSIGQWDLNAVSLYQHFVSTTGFQNDIVHYVFQSLAFGLGYINSVTPANSPNITNTPLRNRDSANFDASKFLLTYRELNRKSEKFLEKYKEDAEAYLDSIIEMSGNWNAIGADVSVSCEYTIYSNDHTLGFLFEFKGPIKVKFKEPYTTYLTLNVIIKNDKGRVIGKTIGIIDKKNFNSPYQVKSTDSLMSNNFRAVGNIESIIVYWSE